MLIRIIVACTKREGLVYYVQTHARRESGARKCVITMSDAGYIEELLRKYIDGSMDETDYNILMDLIADNNNEQMIKTFLSDMHSSGNDDM